MAIPRDSLTDNSSITPQLYISVCLNHTLVSHVSYSNTLKKIASKRYLLAIFKNTDYTDYSADGWSSFFSADSVFGSEAASVF